jgi:hypothetical protein
LSLTYATYVTTIANLLAEEETDENFVQILPSIIDYAEDRCYRELNLLATVIRNSSAALSVNSRSFTLPTNLGTFRTVSELNVITPAGQGVSAGTRNPLTRASLKLLDFLYPTETAPSSPSVPVLFSPVSDTVYVVGPAPSEAYSVEVVGTIQPTPLSAVTTTTYLTTYLPDLMVAASMVFALGGFQKNFTPISDDPQQTAGWEGEYRKLLASANSEETRRRYSQSVNAPAGAPA